MDFLFLDKHARIYGEDILHLNQVVQESNPSRARACYLSRSRAL
jgi:ribulose 1,5-bisphosphate carboxylase large subunit-like protein